MLQQILSLLGGGGQAPQVASPRVEAPQKQGVPADPSAIAANAEHSPNAVALAAAKPPSVSTASESMNNSESLLDQAIALLEKLGVSKEVVGTALKKLGLIKFSDVQAQVENQVRSLVESQIKAAKQAVTTDPLGASIKAVLSGQPAPEAFAKLQTEAQATANTQPLTTLAG